mgnify:CR=1 FL=1|jgi:hypothetical protein
MMEIEALNIKRMIENVLLKNREMIRNEEEE